LKLYFLLFFIILNCWTASRQAPIPDDVDVFRHLAKLYSYTHSTMHRGRPCPGYDVSFPDGIVSGASWYPITGHYWSFVCVKSWDVTETGEVRFIRCRFL